MWAGDRPRVADWATAPALRPPLGPRCHAITGEVGVHLLSICPLLEDERQMHSR